MKLVAGLTWRFNRRLEPKDISQWNLMMESDQAWVTVFHKDVAEIQMPLSKFGMEPDYTMLRKPFPVTEIRVNAPIWVEWTLDLVDCS